MISAMPKTGSVNDFRGLFKETKPLVNKYSQLLGQLAAACNTTINDETDLNARIALVDELFSYAESETDLSAILANVVAAKVHQYKQANVTVEQVSQAEALAHFIDEYQLKQKDLGEIAPQSVISEILRGKRKMTVAHIKGFSRRFGVPEKTFMG